MPYKFSSTELPFHPNLINCLFYRSLIQTWLKMYNNGDNISCSAQIVLLVASKQFKNWYNVCDNNNIIKREISFNI